MVNTLFELKALTHQSWWRKETQWWRHTQNITGSWVCPWWKSCRLSNARRTGRGRGLWCLWRRRTATTTYSPLSRVGSSTRVPTSAYTPPQAPQMQALWTQTCRTFGQTWGGMGSHESTVTQKVQSWRFPAQPYKLILVYSSSESNNSVFIKRLFQECN